MQNNTQPPDTLQSLLNRACDSIQSEVGIGKVANYIPALARINANKFAAAIMTSDGETAIYGDAGEPFSIQSVSKVFTLTLALQRVDARLWNRVGREPSGNPFNSIVQLENEGGIPRNPFINAGAIAVSDVLLEGSNPTATINGIQKYLQTLAQDPSISIDPEVAQSESLTGHRNRSLAYFLRAYRNLQQPVNDVLDVYFNQCAIEMNCAQLARAALFLSNEGIDPVSGEQVIPAQRARQINSVMLMCGHYDASGDFAYRVGLPGKSGVGGAIVVVVPGKATIAVWSPALNAHGNSHAGTAALEAIVRETGWQVL